jgi:DNA invertase Pin-like site-specific DNA recombinase/transcriptional regulator NrdR family protein
MNKTAYLLSRCSTKIQVEHGESLTRQVEAANTWINANYPSWDISSKRFILAGVSGFDGSSLGLGGFIDACKSGEIVAKESVLVIEAMDRLGRLEPSTMRELWRDLQKTYGIDIAIVKFGLVVKHDEEIDLGNDIIITAAMHLSREESAQKSNRIKATFDKRREESRKGGKKRTGVCPSYLILNEDRTEFLPVPERVKVLKRMFDMKLTKDLGPDVIANIFNKEGVKPFNDKSENWSRTTVRKYLTSSAIIGDFQPTHAEKVNGKRVYTNAGDVIKNYYPAVIDEAIYWATQATFKKSTSGRKDRFTNLFRSISICPTCNSNLAIVIANRKAGEKIYLRCTNAIQRRRCTQSQVEYKPIEDMLVKVFEILDYSKLSGDNDSSELQRDIEDLKLHRDSINQRIENELDNVSLASENIKNRIMDRANNLGVELTEANKKLSTMQGQLVSLSSKATSMNLKIDDYTSRQQFNKFLQHYVTSIEPSKDGVIIRFNGKKSGAFVRYGDDAQDFVNWLYKAPTEEIDVEDGVYITNANNQTTTKIEYFN